MQFYVRLILTSFGLVLKGFLLIHWGLQQFEMI